MGLQIEEEGRATLPLTLVGSSALVPIEYRLPVPSAQVKSAILLAGLLTSGRTSVVEAEKTRDHTEKMLAYFGASISAEPWPKAASGSRSKAARRFTAKPVTVPGDPSSAAFLAAAAILCPGSDVLIRERARQSHADWLLRNAKGDGREPLLRERAAAERRAGRGSAGEGQPALRRACAGRSARRR